MFHKKINEVGNPLVYVFLSLMVGCIYYGINEELMGLAIFIVASFFICMFYYCGFSFSCIMSIFFIIGVLINYSYYKVPSEINDEVRITKVSSFGIQGEFEGKSITIKTNRKDLKVGEKYKVAGKINRIQDKVSGVVGEVEPKFIVKTNDDLITKLYNVKRNIYYRLEENLGERKAGLISSIAFGYSDYLDAEDKDDMNNLGIIHSISVSGLHVVIIYGFFRIFLGSKLGIILTGAYVIFTGSSYSSIRAFVMLACVEGAGILKRNKSSISTLCFSAIILVVYQPYCIFNISFQLSYVATLGIIMYNKKLNEKLYKMPGKLRESLSLALSAQVFTLPFLILIFKNFSVNFIVGNLFLAPFVDLMVITGNILVITYIWPKVFDFCSYLNLYIIKAFDWTLDIIDKVSLPMFYGNEYIVLFYFFIMLSFYFVRKGYRSFIYIPLISILAIAIQIYSPILNISYYNEGAILISYRGERVLMANKNQIDIKKLSEAAFATEYYREEKLIRIKDIGSIKSQGKNYILETPEKKYLLKMTSTENESKEYDIINFKDAPINRIFVISGKVV
ncbi:ComEC/Rec2-related protein [Clostridium sp. DL-VIII]|uniref:ComEC/Rec2 family competence protein n=1 Tax=Clostridium sp. DL-VIII TaxID=641107 RepID=UPI00023AF73B|nr:ComEC/Rec2 family competence protein [Clostridium sp. DL-VIII]EHI97980.1 ComEC/Rec2-related protein [Clostridium sp. DL-VIII]